MHVLLVQPPQSDPAQPYSSLAVLLGAWRNCGHRVEAADLNLEFFNYLCSPDVLGRSIEEIDKRLAAGRFRDDLEQRVLERAIATQSWLLPNVPRALGVFRNPDEFYDPDTYAWAFRLVHRALEVVSASAYPGQATLQNFKTAHSYLSSAAIMAAVEDSATNLFYRFCDEIVKPRLIADPPDVLAVSVSFQTQVIPSFTLAAKVKRWLPDVRIVMGGATITRIKDALGRAECLFRDVDAFVLFEGETAFPALLDEWDSGREGLAAPNIMLRSARGIARSQRIHVEDLNRLPSPDHRGLPLDDYWWPEPALLLNSSRGCYYGRCEFCMISPATWGPNRMNKAYRIRAVDKVMKDIEVVHEQTGARAINFSNDILPPRTLSDIGEALAASPLDITWDSEIRLERGLSRPILEKMADGGCRHLRFGFETAVPRVAELMRKGSSNEVTTRILRDCRDVGITVSLLCQVGFPGETREEAGVTCSFLRDAQGYVACVSMTQFVLEEGSGVYRQPEQFGITIRPNAAEEDLSWMYRYDRDDGVAIEDTAELYEEIEVALDRYYRDRDLFVKGGLGHAHTTLYTRRFGPEDFLSWNRNGIRPAPDSDDRSAVRTVSQLSVRRIADDVEGPWSRFIVSSGEVPELVGTIPGVWLILLVAAVEPVSKTNLATLARQLARDDMSDEQAGATIGSLIEAGLLVRAESDRRVLPAT